MATGFVVHMSVPPCLPLLSGRSTGFVLPYLGLRRASVMEVLLSIAVLQHGIMLLGVLQLSVGLFIAP